MTLKQFIEKYQNQRIDVDGRYGYQCWDLSQKYVSECWGVNYYLSCRITGGVKDIYNDFERVWIGGGFEKYPNLTNTVPNVGDLVVWGSGQYGHIAIVIEANIQTLTVFEQNAGQGDGDGLNGDECKITKYQNYIGVLGFITPSTPKSQSKPQLSQVDSIQNVIQTPANPVFSNPVYQNMYEQNRLDMVSDSLDDRADEIEKLKIENQNLRDQIAENQTNFRKDFNQFSEQQNELNKKIISLENKLETKQKSETPIIPILQTQANFNQNPVLDNPIQAENKQKSEIPTILGANVLQNPQTIPSKYFWQSKKFLAVVSSILVGGIATYYKVDVTIVALGMSSFLGYLGIEGAIDIQKANQTTEFIKTFQQNANSQK